MDALDFTREQLAQYILTTAKESSISKIKRIVLSEGRGKEAGIDPFDVLPEYVQNAIDKGLEDIEQGRVKPHEQVMSSIRKRYGIARNV